MTLSHHKTRYVEERIDDYNLANYSKFTDYELVPIDRGDKEHVEWVIQQAAAYNKRLSAKQASTLIRNIEYEDNRVFLAKSIGPFLIEKDFYSLLELIIAFKSQQSKLMMLEGILPYYDLLNKKQVDKVIGQFQGDFQGYAYNLIQDHNLEIE